MVEYYENIQIKFNFIFIYEDDAKRKSSSEWTKIFEQKCSIYANAIVLKDEKGKSINEIITN